jgi:uncharacterized protein YkwD
MRARCGLWVLFLVAIVPLLVAAAPAQQSPPVPNERAALELIAQVNAWRMEQGLWPLRLNPTLQALALAQARYLLAQNPMPRSSDMHIGPNNTSPAERAAADPFFWPPYGTIDRVAIGENAAIGSVRTALSFWRGSDIHQRAALNPGYREVGAAALPRGTDTLFIITFGARPNVLPAFYNPQDGRLYLTSERYQYAPGGARIQNVTQVRLFGSDGQPLTPDWVPWQAVMEVPRGAGETIYVLYSDGQRQALAEAGIKDSALVLPGSLLPTVTPAAASPTPTASPTPLPVVPTAVPAGATLTPALALPTITLPTVPAQPTVAPPLTVADLELRYDRFSLTVLNVAGRPIDISTLAFSGSQVGFAARAWTQVADVPLAAFPAGHCLQLVIGGSSPATPSECRFVRSQVQFGAGRSFWTMGNFDVLIGGALVATCPPVTGSSARCSVVTVTR